VSLPTLLTAGPGLALQSSLNALLDVWVQPVPLFRE
jgi:hypothetical protein